VEEEQACETLPARNIFRDLPSLTGPNDRRDLWVALGSAILIRALALLISFPEGRRQPPPARQHTPVVVKRYVPPPPDVERRQVAMSKKGLTRKIPIPDPTPDAPEPIREPAREIASSSILGDIDLLIGDPTPPGPPRPYGPPAQASPFSPASGVSRSP